MAVLAVLMVTGEYSSGMIRVTLTAVPRRITALAAKAIILTGVVVAAGTVSVLGSVLACRCILRANGFTGAHGSLLLSLGDGPTLRAAALSPLYLALIALLSLGLATALRDSGASITVMLGLLYIVPVLADLGTLDPAWDTASSGTGRRPPGWPSRPPRTSTSCLSGPGLASRLAAWAAAALLARRLLLRLRDA